MKMKMMMFRYCLLRRGGGGASFAIVTAVFICYTNSKSRFQFYLSLYTDPESRDQKTVYLCALLYL